jgi:alginate O-acetyltransferase complex protein AlgI
MQFLSLPFIFIFLPSALLFWVILTRNGLTPISIVFLVLISTYFYLGDNLTDLLLVIFSGVINFWLVQIINSTNIIRRQKILILGIAFNLIFLSFYKYSVFIIEILSHVFEIQVLLMQPHFPVGISFYTLSQIAYLVTVKRYGTSGQGFINYMSFVLFFPKILAGPVIYANDFFDQLGHKWSGHKSRLEDLSVGLSLFCFGAFKKIILSEPLAQNANTIFSSSNDSSFTTLGAWIGILSYTLQLYFDFSGYSDMAIGISRMFGFKLPQNFNSPLRATSFIEFWQGWHMTMTRFFMEHIYNPVAILLTRREFARKSGKLRLFLTCVSIPIIVTFCVSGIWHGPSINFICFGLVSGVGLSINHAWRYFKLPRPPKLIGWILMLVTVMISLIFVRSPDMSTALNYLHKFIVPSFILQSNQGIMINFFDLLDVLPQSVSKLGLLYLVISLSIVIVMPNTQWMMREYSPTLFYKPKQLGSGMLTILVWRPSVKWALIATACLFIALINLRSQSAFVYFAF